MKSLQDYQNQLTQLKDKSKTYTTGIIISFIIFLPSGMIGFSSGAMVLPFIVMGFFMMFGIMAGQTHSKIKALSNEFKEQYLPTACEALIEGSTFSIHGGFDEHEVEETRIITLGDRYYSEDLWQGELDGVRFKTADIVIKEVRSNGKSTTVVTTFQGRLIRLDFGSPFLTDLYLTQTRFMFKFGWHGFQKVEMESVDFNEAFSVFAKDELKAFMILKPDFMEKLLELDAKFSDKIALTIQYNKVYIALKTNKDSFDFDTKGSIPNDPTSELKMAKDVIESLINTFQSTPHEI